MKETIKDKDTFSVILKIHYTLRIHSVKLVTIYCDLLLK